MAIKINDLDIDDAKLGDQQVNKIMLGEDRVWPHQGPSYDLGDAISDGVVGNIAEVGNRVGSIHIVDGGTRLYATRQTSSQTNLYQYDMTAGDASTITYAGVLGTFDDHNNGLYVHRDGDHMYQVHGSQSTSQVTDYTFGTTWDITTAASTGGILLAVKERYMVTFDFDGTSMYVSEPSPGLIKQYTLSTPWDVSTAVDSGKSVSLASVLPYDFKFQDDGKRFFYVDPLENKVYQYSLSTAWDISTATKDAVEFVPSPEFDEVSAIAFNGYKMYLGGKGPAGIGIVQQYSI